MKLDAVRYITQNIYMLFMKFFLTPCVSPKVTTLFAGAIMNA